MRYPAPRQQKPALARLNGAAPQSTSRQGTRRQGIGKVARELCSLAYRRAAPACSHPRWPSAGQCGDRAMLDAQAPVKLLALWARRLPAGKAAPQSSSTARGQQTPCPAWARQHHAATLHAVLDGLQRQSTRQRGAWRRAAVERRARSSLTARCRQRYRGGTCSTAARGITRLAVALDCQRP